MGGVATGYPGTFWLSINNLVSGLEGFGVRATGLCAVREEIKTCGRMAGWKGSGFRV